MTRIEEVHPALKKWLFTKNIGILITSESNVMFKIMQAFMAAKKPLLPIHDAVVCKLSDRKFARRTMIEAYQYVHSTEFKPRIKTEF